MALLWLLVGFALSTFAQMQITRWNQQVAREQRRSEMILASTYEILTLLEETDYLIERIDAQRDDPAAMRELGLEVKHMTRRARGLDGRSGFALPERMHRWTHKGMGGVGIRLQAAMEGTYDPDDGSVAFADYTPIIKKMAREYTNLQPPEPGTLPHIAEQPAFSKIRRDHAIRAVRERLESRWRRRRFESDERHARRSRERS